MELLLEVFALLMLIKSVSCFMKTKKKALVINILFLLVSLGFLIYILLQGQNGIEWFISFYFVGLLFVNLFYFIFPINNNVYVSLLFGLLLGIIGVYIHYNIFHSSLDNIIIVLISYAYVFSLDCSDMKGYTTLNVAESLLLIILFIISRQYFSLIMAGIYFIVSSVAYIKTNKLEALSSKSKSKSKLNREQRRKQQKMQKEK